MMIEYRVRPVTRYIVTRWEGSDDGRSGNSPTISGEYPNHETAYAAAYALCKAEHHKLGYPPGDPRILYPKPDHPGDIAEPGETALGDALAALPPVKGAFGAPMGNANATPSDRAPGDWTPINQPRPDRNLTGI